MAYRKEKTIHQKIADTVLNECQEGDKLTRSEIISLVKTRYPEIPFFSIMPSDVCSNKRNKDPQSGVHHIFYHLERGWYKVLPFETIRKAQH